MAFEDGTKEINKFAEDAGLIAKDPVVKRKPDFEVSGDTKQ